MDDDRTGANMSDLLKQEEENQQQLKDIFSTLGHTTPILSKSLNLRNTLR